jgi:hypothetical protein
MSEKEVTLSEMTRAIIPTHEREIELMGKAIQAIQDVIDANYHDPFIYQVMEAMETRRHELADFVTALKSGELEGDYGE